jgi:hypothetical protein
MGNNQPGRFTNSTPFDVKVSINKDKQIVVAKKSKKEFDAGISGKGSKGTSIAVGDNKATASAEAQATFGYKGTFECESKMNYVDPDFKGFMTVTANTSVEL